MTQNSWNATLYEDRHGFVWQYGADLVDLLAPQPGERILDLGCGTGQLTEQIARSQAKVWGIDSSETMIAKAKANYPHLEFAVADARNFHFDRPFDAVFSNAVLHWVPEADRAIACIRQSLEVGGRFVAEFGGKGNVGSIERLLVEVLEEMGYADAAAFNPWYFPSIGEYAAKLEKQGLEVIYAALFDRSTPLEGGDLGLQNWLEMFASGFLSQVSEADRSHLIRSVEDRLRPTLYRNNTWFADYRRIRIAAVAIELIRNRRKSETIES